MGESSTGPLSGIRVLELTTTVSGPMAAMTLADQGADVIKLEPPLVGDPARYLGPSRGGVSSMFASLNRNKRSVVLDLKDDDERAVFLRLVETADVLIENYRPGVLDRLGLGYETLSALRPELVYASITGYGDGPYQNRRVFDPLIQATSGTAAAQGIDEATNVRTVIFDKVTALTTAQGVTAALLERERTGRGQHLPVTMLESALSYQWPDVMWSHSLVGDGVSDGPAELADWFPLFRAKDGPVAIILTSDQAVELLSVWREAELHLDPRFATLHDRVRNGTAFVESVNALLADVTTAEVCETLDAFGIPVARLNALDEVFDDEQVRHLGSVVQAEHPDAGPMRLARPPVPFHGERATGEHFPRRPAPRVGEHVAEVLAELGVEGELIERLTARDAENAVTLQAMLAARRT
ncbi:MAG: CoA transferase [Acidimicrobiales bacterium]|nr:CoA transferase [Acidimicrobiales bacterium]